jgi:transposase
MDFIGFDLGKVSSQICILTEDGELIERRIRTDRDHFNELLGSRPSARILIETSTESEWVARHLEGLGHEVVIADTNFAPMYATRRQRHVRAQLAVREAMVRTRSRYISLISTLLRRDGLRVEPGHSAGFLKRLERVVLPEALREAIAPLVLLLRGVNEQIKAADERLAALAKEDEVVARLCTAPGVGPVTAATFVSTLDDTGRFAGPKQARAYLGLVPSERSSGERQQRGHISKAGPGRARYMLVEAAWTILRRRNSANAALHEWAAGIAARRGSRVAVVGLARKLAGILYAMWRDGTTFGAHADLTAAAA